MADSVMVYAFPIIVEKQLGSNVLMGMVLSFSSVVGVLCDFVLPQIFHKKQWRVLFYLAIGIATIFPLSTDLGSYLRIASFFVLGSAVWGIYYEFMQFSLQDFVVCEDTSKSYSLDWSIIFALWQVNLILGPILAAFILAKSYSLTPLLIGFFALSSLAIFLIKDKKNSSPKRSSMRAQRASHLHFFKLLKEFSYWKVLGGAVVWILLLGFCLNLNQALFQTIGGLYGQQLFKDPFLQSSMVVLYNASFIPAMLIVPLLHIKKRKKKISLAFVILGGILLGMTPLIASSPLLVLGLMFVSSFCMAFAWPLLEAVYSELLQRTGNSQIHLLSMQKVSASFAYIIGPFVIGKLADQTSYAVTFSIIGAICTVICIFLWFLMPKKVKIPHVLLQKLERF